MLADQVADWFDLRQESPYMLLVADVREELRMPVDRSSFLVGDYDLMKLVNQQRSSIPAVTHIDHSVRIQTVDRHRNPAFYRLLQRFYEITGCPVLINTSFNVQGEPIVSTPEAAGKCFINTGMDLLAIGRFLVFRQEQPDAIRITNKPSEPELKEFAYPLF